jgi:hypothetical protein
MNPTAQNRPTEEALFRVLDEVGTEGAPEGDEPGRTLLE